jgi:tetratricopeptide (TPR) repeat protein
MTDDVAPFGARLAAWRRSAGLSQEELASRSSLSVRAISNLEHGRTRCPHPASVNRLADALGFSGEVRGEFIAAASRRLTPPAVTNGAPEPGSASAGPGRVVPRQLPASAAEFVGREAELARLTGLLDDMGDGSSGTVVISAIGGMAGVGKTTLAVHWAHQAAARFPDGQLYVNLRGFDPLARPMPPDEALRGLLEALDVPARRIPASLEAQTGLYRSLLAGKRMLVVLDNARDSEQVHPLLPGCPGCLALVTSRRQLVGMAAIEGAGLLNLDVLTEAEAGELLARRLGPGRAAAEPGIVTDLARRCEGLPLALAITAARAAALPGLSLSALAAELGDERSRLDALETGDVSASLRRVFSWSYQQLSGPAARLFRLLGLHPGPDISGPAAASLAGITLKQARIALRELASASLLTERARDRYTVHDLLRDYAAEQADAIDGGDDQRAALHRAFEHYLHTAASAAQLIKPTKDALVLARPWPGVVPESLVSGDEALTWMRAERQVLSNIVFLAAATRLGAHAWQICWAMVDYLDRQGRWNELAAIEHAALAAAQASRDATGQAHARQTLAMAATRLGANGEALTHLHAALDLYQKAADPIGQARTLLSYAQLLAFQGRHGEAVTSAQQARDLFRAAGHRAGLAHALNNAGWYEAHLGRPDQALVCCREALGLFQELGDQGGEAGAWDSLGFVHQFLGHYADAVAAYRHAIRLFLGCGDRHNQGETLERLGDTQHEAGQPARARDAWQEALAILDGSDHVDRERIRAKLAELGHLRS